MAFEIQNPPKFTLDVEQWTRDTDADGEEMAKVIEKLLNNDVYNKSQAERLGHTVLVTLTADGWEGEEAPYVQVVEIAEAKEGMEPILVSALEDGALPEVQKTYIKAYGIVCSGTGIMRDGLAVFKVYKKPEADITVGLKGVM